MKSLQAGIAFLLIFSIFHAVLSADDSAAKEKCIKKLNLSADDAKIANEGTKISSKENISEPLKCYLGCYYKEIGVAGSDGKTNLGKIIEYLEKNTGISDKLKITASLSACANVKGTTDCDKVYQFERCIYKDLGV